MKSWVMHKQQEMLFFPLFHPLVLSTALQSLYLSYTARFLVGPLPASTNVAVSNLLVNRRPIHSSLLQVFDDRAVFGFKLLEA